MNKLWWECPQCHSRVDAGNQMQPCFDSETGEAEFAVEEDSGLYFHTIFCPECKAKWVLSISGMLREGK